MKLWGGRFTKEENQLVHNFNESISFDQKFYRQDIAGSIAHVTMLAKQGILTDRADRGCMKETPHRPQQKRPGCSRYEALHARRDRRDGRTFKGTS